MEQWRARLLHGDAEAAWDLFIDRYRRLIFATIRRAFEDDENVLDAFAHVCSALSADDLSRLRKFQDASASGARFSTWLVTVVHHLVIDWLRQRDGRPRWKPPPALSGVQHQIFQRVFVERRAHNEAYELIRETARGELSFGSYLKELAATYRIVERTRPRGALYYMPGHAPVGEGRAVADEDEALSSPRVTGQMTELIEKLRPDERLALQLFVIEELPAADVARTVGWPNAKAVYNRVYRLLATLRDECERRGIRLADL